MSGGKEVDRGDPFVLTSEDRANGFSVVADDCHNITLLKWGEPAAWFSAAVTREVVKEFLELIKDCERIVKRDCLDGSC